MRIGSFLLTLVPFVLLSRLYAASLRGSCCTWSWPAQGMGAWRFDFRMLSCCFVSFCPCAASGEA
ncbi:hypothetical protein HanIR_Chr14g0704791 [Helianthus annuus]|nr:hypothetical protein HanIR_Chr14g0704791 [Helianthus annuus]